MAETPLSGSYILTQNRPAKSDPRDASITLDSYTIGDIVEVVASVTNNAGNIWYKLSDSTYVYSGALQPYGGQVNPSDYFSLCKQRIPTSMGLTVGESGHKISSLPCNPTSDVGIEYNSTYISNAVPAGALLYATEVLENHVEGHFWYHVQYDQNGTTIDGWYYSNYCTDSIRPYAGKETTDVKLPGKLTKGNVFTAKGTISIFKA